MKHAHKKIAERRVVMGIVGDVPAVVIATASKKNWQVSRIMGIGISKIATKKKWDERITVKEDE